MLGILFTEDTFGKGGIGGGAVVIIPKAAGDFDTGIESFLLPGGINSGGSTLGIAYFSNALYTKCIACRIKKQNYNCNITLM